MTSNLIIWLSLICCMLVSPNSDLYAMKKNEPKKTLLDVLTSSDFSSEPSTSSQTRSPSSFDGYSSSDYAINTDYGEISGRPNEEDLTSLSLENRNIKILRASLLGEHPLNKEDTIRLSLYRGMLQKNIKKANEEILLDVLFLEGIDKEFKGQLTSPKYLEEKRIVEWHIESKETRINDSLTLIHLLDKRLNNSLFTDIKEKKESKGSEIKKTFEDANSTEATLFLKQSVSFLKRKKLKGERDARAIEKNLLLMAKRSRNNKMLNDPTFINDPTQTIPYTSSDSGSFTTIDPFKNIKPSPKGKNKIEEIIIENPNVLTETTESTLSSSSSSYEATTSGDPLPITSKRKNIFKKDGKLPDTTKKILSEYLKSDKKEMNGKNEEYVLSKTIEGVVNQYLPPNEKFDKPRYYKK